MELCDLGLGVHGEYRLQPMVALATSADFDTREYLPAVQLVSTEDYTYHNAATCPDCSGGMIRQGRCCICPSCGFESCLF
jgi:hypothetical protein